MLLFTRFSYYKSCAFFYCCNQKVLKIEIILLYTLLVFIINAQN